MDIQVLVPDASGTIGGPALATYTLRKASKTAKISSVQQQHVGPTHLASVQKILVQRGFSQTVATRISERIDVLHPEYISHAGERSNYGANTGKWTLSIPLFPL
jgi:hypothetical protein